MSRRSLPKQPRQRGPPALMMLLVLRGRSWNEQEAHENWTTCYRKIRAGWMDQKPRRCPGGASDALPGAFCACWLAGQVRRGYTLVSARRALRGICRRYTYLGTT